MLWAWSTCPGCRDRRWTGCCSTTFTTWRELIGVTPKRLVRTYRFAATVFAINPAGPIDWGDLAGGAGYFDQAHLGHEFRAFSGLTPTRYVEVRRRFMREHPGHALDGWPLPAD
jgi:AraC-like DNA-binding protein